MNSAYSTVLECGGDLPAGSKNPPLRQSVKQALEDYIWRLDGQFPVNLYKLVLEEIEAPLLEVVMQFTKNNQSEAAKLLKLSRTTLRKKLKHYNLDNECQKK